MEVVAWEGARGGAACASGVSTGRAARGARRAAARVNTRWRPRRAWATCDRVKVAMLRTASDIASMPSKHAPAQKVKPASPHVTDAKVEKAMTRSAGQGRHHAVYATLTIATRAVVPMWVVAEAHRWVMRAGGSWTPHRWRHGRRPA
jgi:hypothetical protein